jgi:hypothetical protein
MEMNMYEKNVKEVLRFVLKRLLMLLSKLIGFKACCLYLATYLLVKGTITQEIWLTVMVTVLCGVCGLRVADSINSLRRAGGSSTFRNAGTKQEKSDVQRAVDDGKKRVRLLLSGKQ